MAELTAQEVETRRVIEQLYAAYLSGDTDGMANLMSEDVWVKFLGRRDFRGREQARRFFGENGPLLIDLDFVVEELIVDGAHAAAIWSESARTAAGAVYRNHGVDVFEVRDGEIVFVHENNDINVHRHHFGKA